MIETIEQVYFNEFDDGEQMQKVDKPATLTLAIGTIEPGPRIASGEIREDVIDELSQRLLTDEFYDPIDPLAIPCECMECRPFEDDSCETGPKAAGGTFVLVMADALTYNSYRHPGEKAPQHARRLYSELNKVGKPVRTHDADIATGNNCGCGAQDKLDSYNPADPSILKFIVNNIEELSAMAEDRGYCVSEEQKRMIASNAYTLRAEGYATSGKEISDACAEAVGPDSVKTVKGQPKGVIFAVNTQHGVSLSKKRVAKAYGNDYQVYSVDLPSLRNGAEEISISEEEANDKELAALIYTLAAGHVVVGPSTRVVAR